MDSLSKEELVVRYDPPFLEVGLQLIYSGVEACFSWLKKPRLQRMVSFIHVPMWWRLLSIYFVLFSDPNAEMIFTVISLVFSCEYQPVPFLTSLHIPLPNRFILPPFGRSAKAQMHDFYELR